MTVKHRTLIALTATVALAAAAGTATVAFADTDPSGCAPSSAGSPSSADLPPVDTGALAETMSGLPNDADVAALVDITGDGAWSGATGVADLKSGDDADITDRVRIGSVSKVFNTSIVLQLVDEGRLGLDDDVRDHLPDLLPADYPAITIGQLLNHTSGLPPADIPGADEFDWQYAHRFDHWDPAEHLKLGFTQPILFEPGTAQDYSNVNSMVAGLVIEQVTGEDWETLLAERIAEPLGLDDTFAPGDRTTLGGHRQHGYQYVDGKPVDVTKWNQSITWASGDVVSTPAELNEFATALFAGDVVPDSVRDNMFTVPDVPVFDGDDDPCNDVAADRSMGLERFTLPNGVVVWGKTGARPGYLSAIAAPADGSRVLAYTVAATDAKATSQLDDPVTSGIVFATYGG